MKHLFPMLLVAALLVGCSSDDPTGFEAIDEDEASCQIDPDALQFGGVPKDGIPALTNPIMTDASGATYLAENNRVIGLVVDGQPIAIPHNILWAHEIVNLTAGSETLAITYCPLTGSSMAFDRSVVGGAEFGVSGLLFQNNLVMYDRNTDETLWPQMLSEGGCGVRSGAALPFRNVIEMTWDAWQERHPDTEVISSRTGHTRNYTTNGYPYGDYERIDNDRLLFPMRIDDTRPPKERLLGIPGQHGGVAFPFSELDATGGPFNAVEHTVDGREVVVFWDRVAASAMAYVRPASVSFSVENGRIVDSATGSVWDVTGIAVEGAQAGMSLVPIDEAYVAFWFAWAAFHEGTTLWTHTSS